MRKQVLVFECDGETVQATRYEGEHISEVVISVKDLPEDDFLFACGYLLDELAKILPRDENKPFEGKTVCIADNTGHFTVGKIYAWKDGRTVTDRGDLLPSETKLYSLDEITNPCLKFIKLVAD